MNAEGRKFLIKKIEKTHSEKVDELEETLQEEPMLNNYLIGAFMDNSIKILDCDTIKKNLKKFIQSLGGEEFVEADNSSYRRKFDEENENVIKFPPELIMELPEEFAIEHKAWKKKKEDIKKAVKELTSKKDTLILQIQIGSNSVLDKLITQVDSLGDLDLFSDKLSMIAEGVTPTQKQIQNGKTKEAEET